MAFKGFIYDVLIMKSTLTAGNTLKFLIRMEFFLILSQLHTCLIRTSTFHCWTVAAISAFGCSWMFLPEKLQPLGLSHSKQGAHDLAVHSIAYFTWQYGVMFPSVFILSALYLFVSRVGCVLGLAPIPPLAWRRCPYLQRSPKMWISSYHYSSLGTWTMKCTNVHSEKKNTKRSSNTILRLVFFFRNGRYIA